MLQGKGVSFYRTGQRLNFKKISHSFFQENFLDFLLFTVNDEKIFKLFFTKQKKINTKQD